MNRPDAAANPPEAATPAGREALAAIAADRAHTLVALDFDGTLSPIVPDPEQARAHPDVLPALRRLAPLVGTVAVITGRPAEVAVAHAGFAGQPGLEHLIVLGAYGAERWEAATGETIAAAPPPGVAAVRAELPGLLAELGAPEGTWIEDKHRALAVHTRRTADPEGAWRLLHDPLYKLAERHELTVEPGKMVLELRPPGMDKGAALTALVRERGARSLLYAGDDLGDVPAFAAGERLRAEGVPALLLACGAPPVDELATRADVVVPDPGAVAAYLAALAD